MEGQEVSTMRAQLRWERLQDTSVGDVVTSSGRVLAHGVTLDEACEMFIDEPITVRV